MVMTVSYSVNLWPVVLMWIWLGPGRKIKRRRKRISLLSAMNWNHWNLGRFRAIELEFDKKSFFLSHELMTHSFIVRQFSMWMVEGLRTLLCQTHWYRTRKFHVPMVDMCVHVVHICFSKSVIDWSRKQISFSVSLYIYLTLVFLTIDCIESTTNRPIIIIIIIIFIDHK